MEELYFFIANNEMVLLLSTIIPFAGLMAFLNAKNPKIIYILVSILMFVISLFVFKFSYIKAIRLDAKHILGETEIAEISDYHIKLKNGVYLASDLAEGLPPTTLVRAVKWERLNITRLCFGEGFNNCKYANEHTISAIVLLRAKDESYYKNKQMNLSN